MNRFLTFISALALTGMIQAGVYEIYYEDLGSGYSFILETETRTARMNERYLNESNFSGGALVIPEKINFSSEDYDESVWGEYSITGELSISWSDDKVKQSLTSVKIPEGITSIGGDAFSYCTNLETIEFPSTLTSIGDYAFYFCTALKSIILPSSLTTIGNYAFEECSQATIEFAEHSSLTSIGVRAFSNCAALKSIILPSSLTTIGDYAFSGCSQLATIEFAEHSSLTSIGEDAFRGCSQLATIEFAEHSSLTSIGGNAFRDCTALKSVEFPKSLVSISWSAFFGCGSLQTISFGENVEEIGGGAFYDCTALENITFNYSSVDKFLTSSVEGFPYGCFGGDWSTNEIRVTNLINGQPMKNVLIPMGMETIKDYAFWNDVNVESVTFPDGFKSIPAGAFRRTAIKELKMPASLETIGDRAFERCEMLEEVTFNEGLKTIGERAFQRCTAIAGIVLPNSVTKAGRSAFAQCEDLESVVLSTSLTMIPRGMFSACYHLAECVIPESVVDIGSYAFGHNFNLREIDLGSNVRSIGDDAFSIADGGGDYEQNVDSWEILNKYASLRQNKFKVKLSEGLKTIGERAFEGREGLDAVRLPSTVNNIGDRAFAYSGLEGIDLPKSVTEMGEYVFTGSKVAYVNFPAGLTGISSGMAKDCPDLMVVNLPRKLQSIGNEALNSASIAAISSPSQLPAATNGNPWESIDNMTCALSIPKPSLVKYMLAEYWGAFVDIRNSIDVTIEVEEPEEEPTPGENPGGETGEDAADADAADDVLTYIDENDYQTMLEEQEENMEEEPAPAEARRRALRTLRRAGVIAPNKGYGKLFNNSSLYRDGGQSTRFFLNVDTDKKYSVMYNGQDITDAVDTETNSFVIDGFDKTSSLHVKVYSGIQSGIDAVDVSADDPFAGGKADIYSTTGICVKPAAMAEDLRMLPSGIYIVNGRKIVVR